MMKNTPEGQQNLGIDKETLAYIEERAANIIRYSDKLSEAIKILDIYCENIGGKIGIRFTDSEIFLSEYKEPWGKVNYRLRIGKDWGLYAANDIQEMDNECLKDVSREMKKEAIKRFPIFLKLYSEAVKKLEREYEDIAGKADEIIRIFGGEKL